MPETRYIEHYRNGIVTRIPYVVTDEELRLESSDRDLRTGPLAGLTSAQADTWIDANVLTLAGARTALKILARLVISLRDRA